MSELNTRGNDPLQHNLAGPLDTLLHAADTGLGRVVEKSWLLSQRVCDAQGRFEVLPDGHFGVGIALSNSGCQLVVGGPITKRIRPHVGKAEIYWLRFRPGVLPRLADVSPRDLIDAPGIALDCVKHVEIEALKEQVVKATSTRARLETLGRFFGYLGDVRACQDHRCRQILAMVDRLDGRINVLGLSREFGLSARTIQRTLMDQVGLSPKQLILNVRLQRTLAKLGSAASGTCHADLATECGYADQSHMIHDFKRLAGRSPGSF